MLKAQKNLIIVEFVYFAFRFVYFAFKTIYTYINCDKQIALHSKYSLVNKRD